MRRGILGVHPDLGGRLAQSGNITEESKKEQASAGLGNISTEELEQMAEMNKRSVIRGQWYMLFDNMHLQYVYMMRNSFFREILLGPRFWLGTLVGVEANDEPVPGWWVGTIWRGPVLLLACKLLRCNVRLYNTLQLDRPLHNFRDLKSGDRLFFRSVVCRI